MAGRAPHALRWHRQTDIYLPCWKRDSEQFFHKIYQILAVEDNVGQKFKLPFQQLNFHYCINSASAVTYVNPIAMVQLTCLHQYLCFHCVNGNAAPPYLPT